MSPVPSRPDNVFILNERCRGDPGASVIIKLSCQEVYPVMQLHDPHFWTGTIARFQEQGHTMATQGF
jgi:hypothetical protein